MMLAAVMPTLRPSIWLASWAARSSQRSARAGDAADIVNSSASNAPARPLDRTTDVRNAIRLVMNTPAPLKLARKIHASAQPRPGGGRGGSVASSRRQPKTGLFALALVGERNTGLLASAIIEEGLAVAAADDELRRSEEHT